MTYSDACVTQQVYVKGKTELEKIPICGSLNDTVAGSLNLLIYF